jgi:hypothetical protein
LVLAGAATGVVNAQAATAPTFAELLNSCNKSSDYCGFHPQSYSTTIGPEHQVGDLGFNCTAVDQMAQFSWSDTTGQSDTVGIEISASAEFYQVYSVSVTATYSHTWEYSSTWTESPTLTIPAGQVGWITRGTELQNATGQWEFHYGKRWYGHYYWYINNYTQTGPVKDGRGFVSFQNRAMTPTEKTQHCPTGTSSAGGKVTMAKGKIGPGGSVTKKVLSTGTTSGKAPSGSASITSAQ